MSLPSTMSNLASISCPASTDSSPACFARIFWVMVIPILDSLLKCIGTLQCFYGVSMTEHLQKECNA